MVRALHDARPRSGARRGFQHTAEGSELGPTLSLRGFDNQNFYRLSHQNRAHYKNFTGCGNTVSFDHPVVRALVLDCLRYWTDEMRVDGFRFDLATVVGRDPGGYNHNAPFFAALRSDPVLAYVKLIAEPWDVGPGGYQLGHFPSGCPSGTTAIVTPRARSGAATAGLQARSPSASPARATCSASTAASPPPASPAHLARRLHAARPGLVQRPPQRGQPRERRRRPLAQPELELRCRGSDRRTRRCGNWRARQVRNLLATLFLSQGVPMLLAGDEFGHTPVGQQQRLLPGQRDCLARLDAAGAQSRAAALRAAAHRPAPLAASGCGATRSSRARAAGRTPRT